MSEDKQQKKSLFDLFSQSQMTFEEAEKKSKQEAGRPKVERFRIGEDGEYPLRIIPLVPQLDENGDPMPLERKGYEYPLFQFFLTINLPGKGKKKTMSIPVVRTNTKDFGPGYSVDLIDTYVKIAKEMYSDDTDLIEAMTKNSFHNPSSLKWSFQHAMYVLDISSDKERAKGPQLWQCTQTTYKAIDDAKIRLWKEMREDDKDATDPIAGIRNAYGVKIIRGNSNGKVDYTVEIGRKFVEFTDEEIQKFIDMPRIPELIYKFDRYSYEAEIEFLHQYDELHDLKVCEQPDFKEAVEKLGGELPADDTRHFDLATAGTAKDTKTEEVTVESLWAEFDRVEDGGYGEKSDEYQSLREKIRQFAEDKDLDVRIAHSKTNKQLLEEVEEAYEDKSKQAKTESKKAEEEDDDEKEDRPARRRSSHDEEEDKSKSKSDDKDDEDEDDDKEEEPRQRRRRPTLDEEVDEDEDKKEEDKKSDSDEEEEERPIHRRRRRE